MSKAIATLFIELEGSIAKFSGQMAKGGDVLDKFGSKAKQIGTKLSAMSLPIAALAGSALKMAGNFEASMNKVSALGGIVGKDLKDLEAKAIQLGASTKYSAKEAADGMGEFAAAGFKASEILSVMPGTLSLAAAGQLDVAKAAEITGATLGQFGLKAEDAAMVADTLASGAARGATSVDDLASGLKYAGTVAKMSGQDLTGLTAAMTLLSNSGIKGADAGTDLAAGFANLLKPTKQALGALKEMGLKLSDIQTASGKLIPVQQIIEKLNKAGISGAQVFALFGKENAKSWSALLQQGAPALQAMTDQIKNDEGAAKNMADTLNKGLNGAFERMSGAVETAGIALGQVMSPAAQSAMGIVEGLAGRVAELAVAFKDQPQWMQDTATALVGVASVMGPLVVTLGLASQAFGVLGGVMAKGAGVLGLLLTPIGAVLAAGGALAVLGVTIYKNWDWIGPMLQKQWETTKSQLVGAWGTLTEAWKTFTTNFQAGLEVLRQKWDEFWTNFSNGIAIIQKNISDLKEYFVTGFAAISESVSGMVDGIKTELQDRLTGIMNSVKAPIDAVSGWFQGLYDKVVGHSYIPDMVEGIRKEMAALKGEAMLTPAEQATDKTGAAFDSLEKKVQGSSKRMAGHLKAISAAIDDVFDDKGVIGDPLQKAISGLISKNDVSGLKELAATWSQNVEGAKQFRDALGEAKKETGNLKSSQTDLSNEVKRTGDNIKKAFNKETSGTISTLAQTIQGFIKAGDESGLQNLYEGMSKTTDESQKFNDALTEAQSNLQSVAQESSQWTQSLVSGLASVAQSLGVSSDLAQGLGQFASGAVSGNGGGSGWGQLGASFGSLFGSSSSGMSTQQAHDQGIQGPGKEDGSFGGNSSSGNGWSSAQDAQQGMDAINQNINNWRNRDKIDKQTGTNAGTGQAAGGTAGGVIGGIFFGAAGAQAGTQIGSTLGFLGGSLFGRGAKNPETQARHAFSNYVEDQFKKLGQVSFFDAKGKLQNTKGDQFNFLEGASNRFNAGGDMGANWGDNFKAMGDDAMKVFGGLGLALKNLLGITEDVSGQMGYLIASNLNGNLDNARLFVQQLGVSQEDMLKALEDAAEKGDMTWHEYNVAVAGVTEAYKEGLVAFGDYGGAFDELKDSGGRGIAAIKGFKDVAVEAMEAGVKTMDELKQRLLAQGYDPQEVEALFTAAANRGINSLEAWKGASNQVAGSIVGDMYALSTTLASKWDDMKNTLDDVYKTIDGIPDKVEKTIDINVNVNDPDGGLDAAKNNRESVDTAPTVKAANGGIVGSKSTFMHAGGMGLMGERGPEAILPLTKVGGKLGVDATDSGNGKNFTVVVNAPYAEHGTVDKIKDVVMGMKDYIVNDAVEKMHDDARRSGFSR